MNLPPETVPITPRIEIAALVLTAVVLLLVLGVHLLPALFAGLLVHELVHALAPRVFGLKHRPSGAKIVVVALLTTLVVALTSALLAGAIAFLRSDSGSFAMLLQKMAEIIDSSRATLPEWAQDWLPGDGDDIKERSVEWLRTHAAEIRTLGGVAGRALAYALVGMVIGALIALCELQPEHERGPLARALTRCAVRLADAFRRVVFAQVRIAALNAALTGIYLGIALPVLGIQLPFAKTMIALTFVVGLLPVIGNLISNTVIVVISLNHSPQLAIASLVFLVVIHKLEYFVNARIVGTQIEASAWELLLAMLLMEAAFGLPGVVAAPVYYAYVKSELRSRGLV